MTRLDFISDPVCPWCLIGAHNLLRALGARASHPINLRWQPYQLNPDIPAEGMDRRNYLEKKFGGPEAAARVYGRIAEAADAAGVDMNLDGNARAPNTLDAHRLIRWAAAEGAETSAAMALFRRYLALGEDISDHGVLADVAAEVGLDPSEIGTRLASDTDSGTVHAEANAAREMGVTGVPTFILDGRYVLTGAQPPEFWVRVIDELAAAADAAPL